MTQSMLSCGIALPARWIASAAAWARAGAWAGVHGGALGPVGQVPGPEAGRDGGNPRAGADRAVHGDGVAHEHRHLDDAEHEHSEQGRHEGSLDRNRASLVARSTSVAAHGHSVP